MSGDERRIEAPAPCPVENGDDFTSAVVAGLHLSPKTIPCKFLYDRRGSELFEAITGLDEYYPTRTELGLLEAHRDEIAERLGTGVELIEYGSGSSRKTRLLLDRLRSASAYVPVDISGEYLEDVCRSLRRRYPALTVTPVVADFTQLSVLPPMVRNGAGRRVVFFPGSTIGNFDPPAAAELLTRARSLVGTGGAMLLGVDLKKCPERLRAAYNDRRGITAEFNLNLLHRINRELDGAFPLERFAHRAIWNEEHGRIEMHLVSLEDQEVAVAGSSFGFAAGETIHTENSYKYSLRDFAALVEKTGFRTERTWTDAERLFSVHLLARA